MRSSARTRSRPFTCAHRFLGEFTFEGTELVYCDPPYLKRTRRSKRRYRFDYEESDHEELRFSLRCRVTGVRFGAVRFGGGGAWSGDEPRGRSHRCVWMNFAPDRLHWARYAGRNFTDRQRIKRKAENWGRRYAALPLAERLAVLGAMMAVEAER